MNGGFYFLLFIFLSSQITYIVGNEADGNHSYTPRFTSSCDWCQTLSDAQRTSYSPGNGLDGEYFFYFENMKWPTASLVILSDIFLIIAVQEPGNFNFAVISTMWWNANYSTASMDGTVYSNIAIDPSTNQIYTAYTIRNTLYLEAWVLTNNISSVWSYTFNSSFPVDPIDIMVANDGSVILSFLASYTLCSFSPTGQLNWAFFGDSRDPPSNQVILGIDFAYSLRSGEIIAHSISNGTSFTYFSHPGYNFWQGLFDISNGQTLVVVGSNSTIQFYNTTAMLFAIQAPNNTIMRPLPMFKIARLALHIPTSTLYVAANDYLMIFDYGYNLVSTVRLNPGFYVTTIGVTGDNYVYVTNAAGILTLNANGVINSFSLPNSFTNYAVGNGAQSFGYISQVTQLLTPGPQGGSFPAIFGPNSCLNGCYGHGSCDKTSSGSYECFCVPGYYMADCSVECLSCPFNNSVCNEYGQCVCDESGHFNESASSQCDICDNFWGPYDACDSFCLNNATCNWNGYCGEAYISESVGFENTGECVCNPLFNGSYCQRCDDFYYGYEDLGCTVYCNAPVTCHAGGICNPADGSCICDELHQGHNCSQCADKRYGPPYCREILRRPFQIMALVYGLIVAIASIGLVIILILLWRLKKRKKDREQWSPRIANQEKRHNSLLLPEKPNGYKRVNSIDDS